MLNLPKFIFINGPAGSGKSTLSRLICESVEGCWSEAFAEPIREMIRSVFFPEDGPIHYEIDLKDGETKNKKLFLLAKLAAGNEHFSTEITDTPTVRQAMIDFSETFMKPRFGEDIFGRLLWKRCVEQELFYSHFIIDGSGFIPEVQYVLSQSSPADCLLIRLHRDGHSFAGDRRSYITLEGVRTFDLPNNGNAADMLAALQLEFGTL